MLRSILVPAVVPDIALAVTVAATLSCAAGKGHAQGKAERTSLAEYAKANEFRQAYGIYFNKSKVGFMLDGLRAEKRGKELVAVREMSMDMKMTVLGATTSISMNMKVVYSTVGKGHIVSAKVTEVEDGRTTIRIGRRAGDRFEIETQIGEHRQKRTCDLPKDTLSQFMLQDWFVQAPIPGTRVVFHTLAMDERNINAPTRLIYLGGQKALWGGVPTDLIKARILNSGMSGEVLMLSNFVITQMTMGGVVKIQAEEEIIARAPGKGAVDVGYWSTVKIDRALGENTEIASLVVETELPEGVTIPSTHRQRVETVTVKGEDGGPVRLRLRRGHRMETAVPLTKEQRADFLAAEPGMEVEARAIRERAAAITKGGKATRARADAIKTWIFTTLEKSYSRNSSSALAILQSRAGDCTEHALLFVTLARAAGIPAREVSGLIYAGDEMQSFAWHAWAEFHDGHQWMTVDAAWNQLPVDATHIRFSTGNSDLSWVHALGKISFTVSGVEKTAPPDASGR
jgi:transglutaminase-like putative cysteine protease